MTATQPVYHKNAAGGQPVKGVECRRCGSYVGLVQSAKTGKWYTCQLNLTMNPDKGNLVAYPWMSHGAYCGKARAEMEDRARQDELRDEMRARIEPILARFNDLMDADRIDEAKVLRSEMRAIREEFEAHGLRPTV